MSTSNKIKLAKFNFITIKEIFTNIHDLKQIDVCGVNISV